MVSRTPRRWRALAPAVAALLVVAGCTDSRGRESSVEEPPVVTVPDDHDGDGRTPGMGNGNGGGGTDSGHGTGTTAGAGGPVPGGASSSTTPRSGSPTTAPRGGTTTTASAADAITAASRSGVGGFARTLLRPQPATRIVVEVLVEPGAEPIQASLDHMTRVLRDVSGKNVSLAGPVGLPAGDGTTTSDEVVALADRHARVRQGEGGQAVIRLLFLRGRFSPEGSVLGLAIRGDVAAVFKDSVRGASSPLVTTAVLEDAVVTHEVGHLLGLVDLALDTGRDDPHHPGHSRNRGSVMYWAVESDVVSQVLDGPPPRDFDADDLRDLQALRNGS